MILKNQFLKGIVSLLSTCFFLFPHSISAKADLIITKIIILPIYPSVSGGETKIRITVKNRGDKTPSKPSSLNGGIWSVSQNGAKINGTNVPYLFSSYSLNIPRLAPNKTIKLTAKHTFRYSGRHRVEAYITTEGFRAGEEVPGNNFSDKIFNVYASLPDLVVCFPKRIQLPHHRRSSLTVKIRNIGQVASAPCDLRFWIEKKGIKHYKIPTLQPGQVYPPSGKEATILNRVVYFGKKRIHKFSLRIDSKYQVPEKYENNNIIQGTICTETYCLTPANTPRKCSNE